MKILIIPTFLLAETPIGLALSLIKAKKHEVGKDNIILLDIFSSGHFKHHELNPLGLKSRNNICISKLKFISLNSGIPLTSLDQYNLRIKLNQTEEKKIRTSCVGVIANYRKTSKTNFFSKNELNQIEKIYQDTIDLYKNLYSFVNKNKMINQIYTFNGRYPSSIISVLVSKKLRISFFLYESHLQMTPVLSENLMIHSPEFNLQLAEKAYAKVKKQQAAKLAKKYFYNRRLGQYYVKNDIDFTVGQNKKETKLFRTNKVKIACFPSSTFEYNFNPYEYKYVDQPEEIRKLCIALKKLDVKFEMHLRLHPNLSNSPKVEIDEFVQLEKEFNEELTVHLPESKTHTYQLLEQADHNIGFASFTMIEAAYFKKNIIQIGPSRYMLMNIGEHLKSAKEAAFIIKNKVVTKKSNSQLIAIKFVCSLFVNCSPMLNFSYDNNIRFKFENLLIEFNTLEKFILLWTGAYLNIVSGRYRRFLSFKNFSKKLNALIFRKSWF